ncbi:MAG: SgcJ/EcaC family oxidoreductase [Blastocatellia bacterium]
MKNIIAAIAFFIYVSAPLHSVAASAEALRPSDGRAEDEAAIHKIVSRLEEAWGKGDGKAFAAPFAEDADYVVVNGMRIKGRDMIAAGHQRIFDTVYKNTHITPTVQSVRFIREGVALVHVEWRMGPRPGAPAGGSKAMNTMVMTKDNGRWSIAAFHNTPIESAQR